MKESDRIIRIVESWVDAGTGADAIVERIGSADGPIADLLRQWCAQPRGPVVDRSPVVKPGKGRKDRSG